MSVLDRLRAWWSGPGVSAGSQRQPVAATYDAAQTTRHNEKHWANADAFSGNAANTVSVRRTLRNRSRYEAANNPLCAGILRTLADHTIGTGPKLQVLTRDEEFNDRVEALWSQWVRESQFDRKLWIAKQTQARDGEVFFLQIGNPSVRCLVQLDYQLLEADYVTSLRPVWTPWQVDGITYDPQWNPISYQIVTQRPNDILPIVWPQQHKVDAKYVLHYFRAERPGQGRGVPEMQSAFELFAVLRRYIQATVSAAEVAASFAAFIKTQGPAGQGAATADEWLTLEIQRNMITMLPEGFDVTQLKPEQPTASFNEFCKTMLSLLTRCLSMPLNIALCDSSGYNYSSSRMDHQTYFRAIDIDRHWIKQTVLERVWEDWAEEAELVMGLAPYTLRNAPHEWHWEAPVSVDPRAETEAALAAVQAGQISITDAQKSLNTGGDVVRENAAYFGVSEDAMRKTMFARIFGPAPGAAAPTPAGQAQQPQAPDEPRPVRQQSSEVAR